LLNIIEKLSFFSKEVFIMDIYSTGIKMLSALGIVLATVGIIAYVAKGFLGKVNKGEDRMIKLISTHYLGGRRSLCLFEVAGHFLLISISPNEISFLTKIEKPFHCEANTSQPYLSEGEG